MRRRLAVLIGAATLAVFAPAVGNGFVNFDDDLYIVSNPHVRAGLTSDGLRWAATTFHASNWHPVTWVSHMLDVSLFGMKPGFHHAINVLLHAANAVLVFLLFERLTARAWASAAAAALFALHPLRVESVAWASQRKDVLAAFFGLAALLAYVAAVRAGRARARALGLFALGLMAKPTLVSLPALMLLIDWWPLARLDRAASAGAGRKGRDAATWRRLLAEKIPFFALAAASSALTLAAQKAGGATAVIESTPAGRLGNAAISVARYLGQTVLPSNLAALYPYSRPPVGTAVAAAALIVATTIACRLLSRTSPFLLFGWLWFLAALLPTLGLVQVGWQSMADRYTYLPSIGLAVAVVWAGAAVARHLALPKAAVAATAAAVFVACSILTVVQIGVWRDSLTLWGAALERTRENPSAEMSEGAALLEVGRAAEALPHFEAASRLAPASAQAAFALGLGLEAVGRTAEGRRQYAEALRLAPGYPPARKRLADLDRD